MSNCLQQLRKQHGQVRGKAKQEVWSFLFRRKKDTVSILSLKKYGITFTGSREHANIFNEQFASVFTSVYSVAELHSSNISVMLRITVGIEGAAKVLHSTKPHKATGLDSIPARILNEVALLFPASLDKGMVLDD